MASQKSEQVIEEMIELSVDVITACKPLNLPHSVVDQLTRAVTSIGANFSEAQDASSRKDFMNKIYIAKKEASETKYWLKVVSRLAGDKQILEKQAQNTQRFIMIYDASENN